MTVVVILIMKTRISATQISQLEGEKMYTKVNTEIEIVDTEIEIVNTEMEIVNTEIEKVNTANYKVC